MAPSARCPLADSEQSSRVTDRRAQCADIYISAEKKINFSCMYFGTRSRWGLEGEADQAQMDLQLGPILPLAWDSTWSPYGALRLPQMRNIQSSVCNASRPYLHLYADLNHAGLLLKLKGSDLR